MDCREMIRTHDTTTLPKEDLCICLSYGKIVGADLLRQHKNNFVVHVSDLPRDKGWFPLTWQISKEKNDIPVILFESTETVDSGPIYKQKTLQFSSLELIDELRHAVTQATIDLCRSFVEENPAVVTAEVQQQGEVTFYTQRLPKDCVINIEKSVQKQFNLLRTVDNERYPA